MAAPPGHEVAGCVTVPGGATRSESVRAALAAAPPGDVVVHDAARPLVTPEHFTAALAALADADCAVAAAPVTDTVKEAGPDRLVIATLDRSRLWAIQTPQASGARRSSARWRSATTCSRRPPTTPGWSSAPAGPCGS